MSHQEKQSIFDKYAKSKNFTDWKALHVFTMTRLDILQNHIFAACDLVQEEQQKRIAENVSTKTVYTANGPVKAVNKGSIINPENKI